MICDSHLIQRMAPGPSRSAEGGSWKLGDRGNFMPSIDLKRFQHACLSASGRPAPADGMIADWHPSIDDAIEALGRQLDEAFFHLAQLLFEMSGPVDDLADDCRLPGGIPVLLASGDCVTLPRPARIARRRVWSSWSQLSHGLSAVHEGSRRARRRARSVGHTRA